MIIAVGCSSIVGEALWAMDTMPFVNAQELLSLTLAAMLPKWPASFRPDEWAVDFQPVAGSSCVNIRRLVDTARIGRGYDANPGADDTSDTTGATKCASVTVLSGAIASGVVLFVFGLVPSANDALEAAATMSAADRMLGADRFPSHHVGSLTDMVFAAKILADAVRAAVNASSGANAAAQGGVELPASKFKDIAPLLAVRVHDVVSVRGDCRSAIGPELPELSKPA